MMIPPIVLLYHQDPALAEKKAVEHMYLTHKSEQLASYVRVYARVLCRILNHPEVPVSTEQLRTILLDGAKEMDIDMKPLLERFAERNQVRVDASVVGGKFSSACYINESQPSLFFLATKYADSLEEALIANTNVGGENCHRGFVLGALLGAALGKQAIPVRWLEGLKAKEELQREIDAFIKVAMKE